MNRMQSLRMEKGLNMKEAAQALKMPYTTYVNYEKGTREPNSEILIKIAQFYGTSIDYLLGKVEHKNSAKAHEISKKIPIYGEVRAGLPTSTDENIEGWEEIYPQYNDSTTYAFLKIKGDSMLPRMQEGDLALVDTEAQVENGDLAVVLVNGNEATIKKICIDNDGITLHAFNPYYPDIHYTPKEVEDLPVRFCGKVVETRAKY